MWVRIKVSIASDDWSYVPGDVVDMDDDRATLWIEGGNAEKYEPEQPKVRSARRNKIEKAILPVHETPEEPIAEMPVEIETASVNASSKEVAGFVEPEASVETEVNPSAVEA